jgi:hypothetical protein
VKTKLVHPFWTHLPAVAVLVIFIVYVFAGGPLPARAPVHFNNHGQANSYGSPWLVIGLIIGLSLLFITTSFILDELWARQEKKKAFNWLSLMDDITVGSMVGINLGYFAFLHQNGSIYNIRWDYLGLVGGSVIVLAILLEILRPYRPYSEKLVEQDSHTLKEEIERHLKGNSSFVYWDYQNPFWVSLMTTLIPLIFIVTAVLVWFEQPWLSVMSFIIAVVVAFMHGGQRVLVTRRNITVRWGMLGIPVCWVAMKDISMVEKREFSPLRDFGGYGIRYNGKMLAFYMRGNRGVKLTTTTGWKYLIGSDNVDALEAVINAVRENG